MNRQRSTWSKPGSVAAAPRQAATSRRADVYTMNQEHPQPSVVEYESGDPDKWAETPTTNKNIEQDYDGDRVRRNEVGFGEFRKDTFDHKDSKEWGGSGKYDNAREAAAIRKANYALDLSRELLRTDDAGALMAQASDLMALPARAIQSTLQRIEKLSPDALPRERKIRRATACCKLASRVLPDGAPEQAVERLATLFMRVDDPTLRAMLSVVASVHVAKDEEEDEKAEGQSAGEKKDEKPEGQQAQQEKDEKPEGQQAQQVPSQDPQGESACLTAEDMHALDQMLAEEGCGPAPMPAPAVAPELTTIFQPPVTAPAMASGAPEAQVAAEDSDISFDDEEEGHVASESSELASLFDEHPEVVAQREIHAAEQQVYAQQGGYGSSPATRTASTAAKKIGNVRPDPAPRRPSVDADLASIWERPPAM
jgi:hypothetical protein